MAGRKKRSLIFAIMSMSVLPIAILGIIMTVYSQNSVREGMVFEVEKNLSGIAHNLISTYNMLDAGEFSSENGKIIKGETELTADYRLLDDVKNDTGADVTIFIGNERCLTTLVDEQGKRLVGSQVSERVEEAVLEEGEEYFSESVDVMGEEYFGYYVPIRNDSDEVVGISFAGKSAKSVNMSMRFMIQGNVIICLFIIILAGFMCNLSAQKMVDAIQSIKNFLGKLAQGEFSHRMPEHVLNRRDELAEMGEYAVSVSQSLEDMISRDPLTKLLNRRAGLIQLNNRTHQDDFTIAMADIDFFKKVNDTYGHEVGDEVLCYVADCFHEMMCDIGFSARWGGEEFLLGFDGRVSEMKTLLERFRERIIEKKFTCADREFSISLTFGVAACQKAENFEAAIQKADALLYYGKEHGRDQIVTEEDADLESAST